MNELIKINHEQMAGEQVNTVNARELHEFLEIGKVFGAWITERIDQFEFKENQDFVCFPVLESKGRGGHNKKEYHLTIDMAKELSMVERNEKGKQARQYFIECERRLHSGQTSTPDLTHNVKALYPHATKYLEIMNQSSEFDTRLCQTISNGFADYLKETNANTSGTGTPGTPRRPANPSNPIKPVTPLKRGNTWQEIKAKKSKRNTITMSESQVIEQIQTLTAPQKERLFFILRLLKQKNQTADKLSQSELAEQLKINRKTIHNDMIMLIAGGLVKTNRGYCPTAAFPMFFERLMGD